MFTGTVETTGSVSDSLTDPPHADNTKTFTANAMAEH